MVVYWSEYDEATEKLIPRVEEFPDGELQLRALLDRCQVLRNTGKLFVTSASHHETGVSGVIDGKLPDGTPYTWKKRRI